MLRGKYVPVPLDSRLRGNDGRGGVDDERARVRYVSDASSLLGQGGWQSWQTTQSSVRLAGIPSEILDEGDTSVGQTLSHFSQDMQFLGGLTIQKLRKLSGAISPPIGHRTLQNARLLNMTSTSTATSIASFTTVETLIDWNPPATMFGTVTWSADAGQTLQNE